jgi:hypothetical protein
MGDLFRSEQFPRLRTSLPWVGLLLVAALSVPPLLVERPPVRPVDAFSYPDLAWTIKAAVVVVMCGAIRVAVWATEPDDPWAIRVELPLVVLAGLMAAFHWHHIDSVDYLGAWQRDMYFKIFNHTQEPPHLFRTLPYGFTRSLEHVTGDWEFSCLAYRWFFSWWFVWGCYRFARTWFSGPLSLLTLLSVAALYPLSVWYYWGQLTDPLSHSLFVFACLWAVRDRTALLAAALFLGVLAKETVVLIVPAYWACYWRGGLRPLLKAAALGAACVAAFLAARLPFGWAPGYGQINGTEALMVLDNLGFAPDGRPYQPGAPVVMNYLHPALFVLPFVPFLAYGWQWIDGRLRALVLVLTPLLLLSNLCFGWMYESRNYVPLLPLLGTAALFAVARPDSSFRDAMDPRRPEGGG